MNICIERRDTVPLKSEAQIRTVLKNVRKYHVSLPGFVFLVLMFFTPLPSFSCSELQQTFPILSSCWGLPPPPKEMHPPLLICTTSPILLQPNLVKTEAEALPSSSLMIYSKDPGDGGGKRGDATTRHHHFPSRYPWQHKEKRLSNCIKRREKKNVTSPAVVNPFLQPSFLHLSTSYLHSFPPGRNKRFAERGRNDFFPNLLFPTSCWFPYRMSVYLGGETMWAEKGEGDILLQTGKAHARGRIPFPSPLFRSRIPCPNYAPARLLPPLSPIFLFFFSPFFPKWFFSSAVRKKGGKSCECSIGEKMGLRRLFGFLPLSFALCTFCGRGKDIQWGGILGKGPISYGITS